MSHVWFLQWKFSHCIEGVSASISGSETTFPTWIERVNHNLRETGIFMTHALAGCGRRNVRDEDVLYTITQQPADITYLLQQNGFLREQHGLLCVRISCILFHLQPVQMLQQGTNTSIHSFFDECYARLCTLLNFCALARNEGKNLCHGSSGLWWSN
jgi:hypothetical protein